jgi:hypothetical protein
MLVVNVTRACCGQTKKPLLLEASVPTHRGLFLILQMCRLLAAVGASHTALPDRNADQVFDGPVIRICCLAGRERTAAVQDYTTDEE